MKQALIAALVLASLALSSFPVAYSSSLPLTSATAPNSARLSASSVHDHSCCPGLHPQSLPPLFVAPAPATMPCGDQHPCCAKQGPQNPLSLPVATSPSRFGAEGAPVTIADYHSDGRTRRTILSTTSNPVPPGYLRSTVLRI